jgi:hypothetical protein
MSENPALDDIGLQDAEAVGGLKPTSEPGVRRGHNVRLVAGKSHTMSDGAVFLDDKELIGVTRFVADVPATRPLPKIVIEMRAASIEAVDLPVDVFVQDDKRAEGILQMMAQPTKISLNFAPIDKVEVEMRAIIFKIRWLLSIIMRPWPFYLRISFPTRKKASEAILGKKVWVDPWIEIGESH